VQDSQHDALIDDVQSLNLKRHTSEVVGSIVTSKLNIRDQDTIIEICVLMHQKYEDFAPKLLQALEKQFFQD